MKQSPLNSRSLILDEDVSDSHFDSFGKRNLWYQYLNLSRAKNSGFPTLAAKSNSNLNEFEIRSPTKSRREVDNELYCVLQNKKK